ncbi:11351_t:CDS:2 [Cetraspora pellucida]|uniref:11351_t:CDS:1 n=1 Tax=Cetraspora pellucida TaxID=1433469 RepID=A0ACA9NT74_9GLOM|nr:11351_t:CDS:2 [Cetraspora pellucida]
MDELLGEQIIGDEQYPERDEGAQVNPDQVNVILREIANTFHDATLEAINDVRPEGCENNWVWVEANLGNTNDNYYLDEREMYVLDGRYQFYDRENRGCPRPNSESQWEGWLRSRKNVGIRPQELEETYHLIDDDDLMQDSSNILTPVRAPRRKRDLSVVDFLAPYNIVDDILSTRANATYDQLLQYLNQRRYLAKALQRPLVPAETNYVNVIEVPITNSSPRKLHQMEEKEETEDPLDDDNDLFDQLVYENEEVEETEGYYMEEIFSEQEENKLYVNPWQDIQSPTAYLSNVEELPTNLSENKKEPVEEKIRKMEVSDESDLEQ